MSAPRRAVYRALIGGYEQLREEEVAREPDLPFICFTDDPHLTSDTWEVVLVERRLPRDATRSARALKIIGHPVLDDYDETLWVDNTVALVKAPDDLFDDWLSDADVAAPLHSYRTSVLAEAEAVIDGGLDDFTRVYEQVAHHLMDDSGVLEENPHWTGMLARRRTPVTDAAMQTWWEQVLRHSRRDQLSFVPAMRAHDVRLRSLPVDSHESPGTSGPERPGGTRSGRARDCATCCARPQAGSVRSRRSSARPRTPCRSPLPTARRSSSRSPPSWMRRAPTPRPPRRSWTASATSATSRTVTSPQRRHGCRGSSAVHAGPSAVRVASRRSSSDSADRAWTRWSPE